MYVCEFAHEGRLRIQSKDGQFPCVSGCVCMCGRVCMEGQLCAQSWMDHPCACVCESARISVCVCVSVYPLNPHLRASSASNQRVDNPCVCACVHLCRSYVYACFWVFACAGGLLCVHFVEGQLHLLVDIDHRCGNCELHAYEAMTTLNP